MEVGRDLWRSFSPTFEAEIAFKSQIGVLRAQTR